MNESDGSAIRAGPRGLVHETHPACTQRREGCVEVVDFDRDVVQSWATPRQKRRNRRLAAERLQHFKRTPAEVNEPHTHSVRGRVDRGFGSGVVRRCRVCTRNSLMASILEALEALESKG